MKKVIITGANGQDGAWMIEYLLNNTNNAILAATRRTSQPINGHIEKYKDNPRVKFIHIDLCDPHSIEKSIFEENPDYFINFGASAFVPDSWNSPAMTMQVNAVSLIHILESVRKFAPSCRVYNACSSEIFGEVLETPQKETTRPNPQSIYGVSKNAAREIARVYKESYGIYVVSGILFNHESQKRQTHYISRKITTNVARIAQAIKNKESFEPLKLGNLEAKRDFSYAPDVIDGVWRMLNQELYWTSATKSIVPIGQEYKQISDYILASGETHTIKEFVELAFQAAGIEGVWVGEKLNEYYILPNYLADFSEFASQKLVEIDPKFFRPAEVNLLLGDATLAKTELNWQPKTDFKSLVKKMVEWDIKELNK